MRNFQRTVQKDQIHITDIAPTVLDWFGIPPKDFEFDGTSIFA